MVLAIVYIWSSCPAVASRKAGFISMTWSVLNTSRAKSRSSAGMRTASTTQPAPLSASAAARTVAATSGSIGPKPGSTSQPTRSGRPGAVPRPASAATVRDA